MDPNTQLQYFRKEHQDIRRFLERFRSSLTLVHSKQDEMRRKGLGTLRDLQPDLQAIQHHCDSEERNLDSPYGAYLQAHQFATLRREHDQLRRLTQGMVAELQFATTTQLDDIYGLGLELAQFVSEHIAYEETLLLEIEQGLAAQARQLPSGAQPQTCAASKRAG